MRGVSASPNNSCNLTASTGGSPGGSAGGCASHSGPADGWVPARPAALARPPSRSYSAPDRSSRRRCSRQVMPFSQDGNQSSRCSISQPSDTSGQAFVSAPVPQRQRALATRAVRGSTAGYRDPVAGHRPALPDTVIPGSASANGVLSGASTPSRRSWRAMTAACRSSSHFHDGAQPVGEICSRRWDRRARPANSAFADTGVRCAATSRGPPADRRWLARSPVRWPAGGDPPRPLGAAPSVGAGEGQQQSSGRAISGSRAR